MKQSCERRTLYQGHRAPYLEAELHSIEGQCPFNPRQIKVVFAEKLQITKLIAQAQSVVRLKLITVARPADALEILSVIRIPCPELPD